MDSVKQPSELELFLRSQTTQGQVDSQGEFTVSLQKALGKLAEFALPFSGAWAVKIIQGLVATGTDLPIRVDLLATEIGFYFLKPDFSLREFADQFATPEPASKPSLRHLLTGLWNVALKERWGFQLALADSTTTLIWDGHDLHRVESSRQRDCACLTLAPLQQKSKLSWVAGVAMSGHRNAELLMTLAQRCYLCPVPLTVDGRRLDSLQRSPHNGWGDGTFPFTVSFAEADLPRLRIPPGTFSGPPIPLEHGTKGLLEEEGLGWKRIGQRRMSEIAVEEESPLPFILCANMKRGSGTRTEEWVETTGYSTLSWVVDGAVIAQERLFERRLHVSLGCFVSAEGLETDLTTLNLLESAERQRRFSEAALNLHSALRLLQAENYDEVLKTGITIPQATGGLMVFAGVSFFLVAPGLGVGLTVVGALKLGKTFLTGINHADRAREGLEDLISALGSLRLAGTEGQSR